MKELCIPLPHFMEHQVAELEVTINGKKQKYNFRVESFPWCPQDEVISYDKLVDLEDKISNLKNHIANYEKGWELIQIYTPQEDAKRIQVLFRQKDHD